MRHYMLRLLELEMIKSNDTVKSGTDYGRVKLNPGSHTAR